MDPQGEGECGGYGLEPAELKGADSLALNTLAERGPRDVNGHNISGEYYGSPHKFLTWNCNGLAGRMKKKDLDGRFYNQIGEGRPDIISLQEIKLECEPGHPDKVKRGSEDEDWWNQFIEPLERSYNVYLSLSSKKYGGQAVLVKKSLMRRILVL